MNPEAFSFTIPVEGAPATSGRRYAADRPRATLVLAHGAGAPQTHPWMVAMAGALVSAGIETFTFNFLYSEQRRGGPDRPPVLEATWRAALAACRGRAASKRVFIGGKSMGGRIATHVGTDPALGVEGIVLLGYPLHPPGRPQDLRTAHLARVTVPMLFVQGERDTFGSPDELRPWLEGLPRGTRLLVIEGGDHSLATPKKSGTTLAQTLARVAGDIGAFIG